MVGRNGRIGRSESGLKSREVLRCNSTTMLSCINVSIISKSELLENANMVTT